jgi:hypothetical protein
MSRKKIPYLLAQLAAAGPDSPAWLLSEIIVHKEECAPFLLDLIVSDMWRLTEETRNLLRQAVRLLGEMQVEAAVEPLLGLLGARDCELYEEVPLALARIGEPALGRLQAILLDQSEDLYARVSAAHALAFMAAREAYLRPAILDFLREMILMGTGGRELLTFIVVDLADLGASEALVEIRWAFRQGLVAEEVITLEEVECRLRSGEETPRMRTAMKSILDEAEEAGQAGAACG